MISNNLPLFNWNWGMCGAIFMLLLFLGHIIALLLFMRGGKKQS